MALLYTDSWKRGYIVRSLVAIVLRPPPLMLGFTHALGQPNLVKGAAKREYDRSRGLLIIYLSLHTVPFKSTVLGLVVTAEILASIARHKSLLCSGVDVWMRNKITCPKHITFLRMPN